MKRPGVVRDYGGISAVDRRAERRGKLLAAGRRIWGESGIGEVTVRGVCAAAGLIPRYFYEQFPNRDALLFAVSDDVRDQLLEAMVTAGVGDPGTLSDKLRSALTAFLDLIAADPYIHRIATSDLSAVPGLNEHRARILDLITDSVVEHAPGVLDSEVPPPAELRRGALFIVGGVNQIIEAWLANPVESTTELAALCSDLAVALVRSITSPQDHSHH
ncbi:TetR/AcrR family transcriptional regulator [Mycolicibacter terrae]|uniref:TetR/AcrR family transcriptional regulator n=1 Tax=Mycolicibacter terrae TaxID=1788 RepID=UPI000A150CAF|nr:TetR/AcrR family transcriptional regulator [Mycolicibacter terrae]ORW94098.1 transcriptional regulator [Mycolicibacter terrae]SNV77584.1 TetR family transcriptional regulator [Mycolicibacter terrae]